MPVIRPSRGTHITLAHADAAARRPARSCPAGGGRTIFALPWLGRTLIGTTDNDYDGRPRPRRALAATTSPTCSTPSTRSSPPTLGPGDLTGAFAGVRPLISTGDPQEVGRHLAQGRALRDLERNDHDHRRQAHDLAADGEDGGRPARRARRPRRPVPHARDPARQAIDAEELPRVEGVPEAPTRRSPPATATPRASVLAVAAERGELAQPIVAGLPDLLAEAVLRGAPRAGAHHRRRAAAPHAPRPAGRARARRRRRCGAAARGARHGARARLGRGPGGERDGAFRAEAAAEGIAAIAAA